MDEETFFDQLGIHAGQHKPSWVFRGGIVVVNREIASFVFTDIDSDDLDTIAKKTAEINKRVLVLSGRQLNYLIRPSGYERCSDQAKEVHLLDNAAIGILQGNLFIVEGEYANDVANEQYLPSNARVVDRETFKELVSID